MARIEVQMYEIQDPQEAEAVIELGVDRIGSVILTEGNWKVPAIRDAISISKGARVKHSLIPLFHTKGVLFRVIEYYQPDIIHFCERLTYDDGRMMPCEAFVDLQIHIRERFPEIEVMRSVPVVVPESSQMIPTLEIAECFEVASDYFLTDTWLGSEPVEGYIGITGRTCDWAVARGLAESSPIPVILAGGMSPENVYEGVMIVRPFGVDSCTGTNAVDSSGEPVRFKKDPDKVAAFVQEVRRAEKDLKTIESGTVREPPLWGKSNTTSSPKGRE
jgi:phosphoribosylanthranilate isomerase